MLFPASCPPLQERAANSSGASGGDWQVQGHPPNCDLTACFCHTTRHTSQGASCVSAGGVRKPELSSRYTRRGCEIPAGWEHAEPALGCQALGASGKHFGKEMRRIGRAGPWHWQQEDKEDELSMADQGAGFPSHLHPRCLPARAPRAHLALSQAQSLSPGSLRLLFFSLPSFRLTMSEQQLPGSPCGV